MLKAHGLQAGANMLAAQLAPIEESFDDTIAAQARLIASTVQARRMAGLPCYIVQDALAKASASLATIMQARGEFIAAHTSFATLRDDLGVAITADGSSGGCPHDNFVRGASADRVAA